MGHLGQDHALLRLLEATRDQVGAREARLELGGSPPSAPEVLYVTVPPGLWRIVVTYDAEPADRAARLERLGAMAEAFQGFIERRHAEEGGLREPVRSHVGISPQAQLDEALLALAETTGALSAVIVDSSSPVLWGRSHDALDVVGRMRGAGAFERLGQRLDAHHDPESLRRLCAGTPSECVAAVWPGLVEADSDEELLRHALDELPEELERLLLTARAIAWARAELTICVHESRLPLVRQADMSVPARYARGVSDVYALTLAFSGAMVELAADGAVRRATPHLERLLETIPPFEPPPVERGARITTLRRPRG